MEETMKALSVLTAILALVALYPIILRPLAIGWFG
jgi:hypothetical protein